MTVLTDVIGLLPVMLSVGLGSEVMKRIAAPVVGGLLTSTVHTLIMIPALYAVVHGRRLAKTQRLAPGDGPPTSEPTPGDHAPARPLREPGEP
jgi:Cu(I)/Ag(I) efflux system membrane protein CusA/SilA